MLGATMSRVTGGVFVGYADADVVKAAVVAECHGACFVDVVVSD